MHLKNSIIFGIIFASLINVGIVSITGNVYADGTAESGDVKGSVKIQFWSKGKYFREIMVNGTLGSVIDINKKVPEGYVLAEGEDTTYTFTGINVDAKKYQIIPKEHNIKFNFKDVTGGDIITSKSIKKHTEERIGKREIYQLIPDNYILSLKSKLPFEAGVDDETIDILVIKNDRNDGKVKNILTFDSAFSQTSIRPYNVIGKKFEKVKLNSFEVLGSEHIFSSPIHNTGVIEYEIVPDESPVEIGISDNVKDSKPITLIDSKGHEIIKFYVSCRVGDTIDLKKEYAKQDYEGESALYDFSGNSKITVTNFDNESVEINKSSVYKDFVLLDENETKIISIRKLLPIGYLDDISSFIPYGYELCDGVKGYDIKDDVTPIRIHVKRKKIFNIFKIIDADTGKIIFDDYKLYGYLGGLPILTKELEKKYDQDVTHSAVVIRSTQEKRTLGLLKRYHNKVNFINFRGDIVGTAAISGYNGKLVLVHEPKGYEFPSNYLNKVKVTADKKIIRVLVYPIGTSHSDNVNIGTINSGTNSIATENNEKIEKIKGILSTLSKFDNIPLFNSRGDLSNRQLSKNSSWMFNAKKKMNGKIYYRVSSDEWIRSDYIYEYHNSIGVITTNIGKVVQLYNSEGEISNRGVCGGSSWKVDRMKFVNGVKYYRVSTDEWISEMDIFI